MMSFRGYLDQIQEGKRNRYEYSSTHVLLPIDLAASVVGWGQENVRDDDLYKDPREAGYGRETEPHVTILYGLYTTKARDIRPILDDTPSFDVRLGEVSIFQNDYFDVLKVEVKCKALHDLNAAFREELDHKDAYPVYSPHVTIAYIKNGRCKGLVGDEFFKGKSFPVKEVVFSSKTGEKATMPLRGRRKS